jgi:3',5'-cyclic AMP phosphodiesterase CpdA
MTRLLVISDLHLEMSDWDFPEAFPPHDVAVFAGDVWVPLTNSVRKLARARAVGPLRGSEVVLVPGNHEFYGHDMPRELEAGAREAREHGIHLLDCGEVHFGDLRVLGCTLWTDYELDGTPRKSMEAAGRGLNDHRRIRVGERFFAPSDALAIHRRHRAWLSERLRAAHDGATVVVTHHCPSRRSVHPSYALSPINPGFASDLDELILETRPELWVHGHTHSSFDYVLGVTRVLCNPKGYGPGAGGNWQEAHENAYGFDESLVVEVPPPG